MNAQLAKTGLPRKLTIDPNKSVVSAKLLTPLKEDFVRDLVT